MDDEEKNTSSDNADDMKVDESLEKPSSHEMDDENLESLPTGSAKVFTRPQLKKDDSGICVVKPMTDDSYTSGEDELDLTSDKGTENDEGKEFCNIDMKSSEDISDKSSPDSGHHDGGFNLQDSDVGPCTKSGNQSTNSADCDESIVDDQEAAEVQKSDKAKNKKSDKKLTEDKVTLIPKPKYSWFICSEITQREYGVSNNFSTSLFNRRAYGSLHMVERLELMYKMKRHEGCVNSLHFNRAGTRLASGSDDLNIVIWDWAVGEPVLAYDSGHRSNVFQAKFMPLGGDSLIVSCARDGQVRLSEISVTGVCRSTRKLAQHHGTAHKLALEADNPHSFLSCAEDAVVFEIDLRENKPEKLLTCKENDRKIELYSIFSNPYSSFEFATGGRDHFVRIYDKRKITETDGALKKFSPEHLLMEDSRANVTCLVYNYNGSEILATYNDEDIYTFDTSCPDGSSFKRRFCGHRNSSTVKGVNYFGPHSEYIVSGSDCGNIFIWEKHSGAVVQFMAGDEGGVVNCLEPHPHVPIMATSGLDDDVKIWVPSCENPPKLSGLKSIMRANEKDREEDKYREPDAIDGQMLWFLMHHFRRSAQRRARQEGQQTVEDNNSSENNDSDSDELDDMPHAAQCSTS